MKVRPRFDFFIGPSLPPGEAAAACAALDADVRIRPPAEQGSLLQLLEDPPEIVGLVDGCFLQVPSVLHKEILLLLACGTRVLGAASLGALRAAELHAFGMEGIGEIYRLYESGAIDADDEVAVLHAPPELGWRPLTEPLVNVRFNVERARQAGAISRRTAAAVMRVARAMHFGERTYDAILRRCPDVEALRAFLAAEGVDLKRKDALELVRTVGARLRGEEPWPAPVEVPPLMTKYFLRQVRDYAGAICMGQHVPDALVLAFVKATDPRWPRTLARLGRRRIAGEAVDPRFAALPYVAGGVPDDEFLLTELKRGRGFAEARAAVAGMLWFHADAGLARATIAREELFRWAARRWGCTPDDVPRAMRERGFLGEMELLTVARLLWLSELFGASRPSGALRRE